VFNISGEFSKLALRTQSILNSTDLNTDPKSDESFTLVLFRIDPVDGYMYALAHSKLAEPEPLFTPRIATKKSVSPRGFKERERIPKGDKFVRSYPIGAAATYPAILWVSRRRHAEWKLWEQIESRVLNAIEEAFSRLDESRGLAVPLYPSIWNSERIVLDKLRARVRSIGAFPPMAEVVGAIRCSIAESFHGLLGAMSQVRVGVYLFTGDSWAIPGGQYEGHYIPGPIRATDRVESKVFDYLVTKASKSEHAFDWVHRSGRPVLIRDPISPKWQKRLDGCGVAMPPSGGLCIAPIQYDREDALVSGLLLVSFENPEPLGPAFCFLTTRVAQSIPGYLAKLSAAPGFPWWPEAKVARGRNEIVFVRTMDDTDTRNTARDDFEKRIEVIAQSMMPDRSHVYLTELVPGLTDTVVYEMNIVDEKGIVEIPRVLKVGDAQIIGDELHRYFRYVHNKPVGGESRLDVAMCFPDMPWISSGRRAKKKRKPAKKDRATAAIAYTFVGTDAEAVPWSSWAPTATQKEIQVGIRNAMEHLSCWHRRGREETKALGDLLVKPSARYKQAKRTAGRDFLGRTGRYMDGIRKVAGAKGKTSPSCIAHGDLHCENLFALLGKDGDLKGKLLNVAIIDWGKVESGSHPSTDLAILLGDLAFRVKAIRPDWALKYLVRYARTSGLDANDCRLVFCFHLMRMLAWGPLEGKEPWIPEEEAASALRDIEQILIDCGLDDLVKQERRAGSSRKPPRGSSMAKAKAASSGETA
jgi:hypothetical protein